MSTPQTTRRSFYLYTINLLTGLVAVAAAIPTAVYLLLRPKSRDATNWIEITDLSRLRVGQPEEIVYNRKRTDGWRRRGRIRWSPIIPPALTWDAPTTGTPVRRNSNVPATARCSRSTAR